MLTPSPFEKVQMIKLPKIGDPRGNLTFVEGDRHLPFDIKRIYYLYDIPGGESRAGHGHKQLQQLIIALSGSFTIELDDGRQKKTFQLNRPYIGLYLPPMLWRDIYDFSSGSVCLVLASEVYDEADYYRNYQEFVAAVHQQAQEHPYVPFS